MTPLKCPSLSLVSQVVNLTSRSIKSFAYRITFASVGRQHACALPYPNLSLLTILAHHDLLTFSSSHESIIVIALIMEFMIPLGGTITRTALLASVTISITSSAEYVHQHPCWRLSDMPGVSDFDTRPTTAPFSRKSGTVGCSFVR